MAYSKTTWVNNSPPAISADNLNKMEQGIYDNDSAVTTLASSKVDKITGKGLSTNDFTDVFKNKLNGIAVGAEVNVQSDWRQGNTSSDDFIKNKPTRLSEFTNDSGFITSTVNNLTNYYLKSDTYTKSQVDNLIGSVSTISITVVQTLPTTGQSNTIYLVPQNPSNPDIYNEYVYANNTWVNIGSSEIDLSDYYTKTESDAKYVDWESNSYLGAKNLNSTPYSNESRTSYGITWTVNADGTVTANGTATANSTFLCHSRSNLTNALILPNGSYIISGCPSGGGSTKYYFSAGRTSGGAYSGFGNDYGDGRTITLNGDDYSDTEVRVHLALIIANGYTANNLVFKPMIRLAGDNDNTWQPYSQTNRELTVGKYDYASANLLGAKNLVPYPFYRESGYTNNGATITYDDNGVMTVNKEAGTSTATFVVYNGNGDFLKPDTGYILSLELENANGFYMYISNDGTDLAFKRDMTTGYHEVSFITPSSLTNVVVGLKWANTVVETNATAKIMIRPSANIDRDWQPYAMTNYDLTNNKVSLEQGDKIEAGVWNVLRQPYSHGNQRLNGVNFTVNADGSVTADGTAGSTGGNVNFNLKRYNVSNYHLPKGTYFLSGCPSGGQLSTYRMRVGVSPDTSTSPSYPYPDDFGNGAFFTIADESVYLQINIVIIAGVTVNNLTFYPRIVPVKIPPCDKTTAGTYTLQCVVDANGNQTYSWV